MRGEIRTAFVAPKGKKLVSADYSQIELRVLAHVADIPQLKRAFAEGQDIHAMTASEMFGVPIEGMDPMIRRQAKKRSISGLFMAFQALVSPISLVLGALRRVTISKLILSASQVLKIIWKQQRNKPRICRDALWPPHPF